MEECYRRFLSGDDRAFDSIVEAYSDNLIFFIQRYVHDPAAAEDLALDALADLIIHPHRYNFRVSLKTYLFMVGRSRALNYLRRQKRFPTVELSDTESAPGKTPEELVLLDEGRRQLNAALSQLPQPIQSAVHLVYFEGLSYGEAAKVLKKTPKQVDNLLYRGKKSLRSILMKEGVTL